MTSNHLLVALRSLWNFPRNLLLPSRLNNS